MKIYKVESYKALGFILLFLLLSYAVPANAATTFYFGGAKKTLSSSTDEVTAGYYSATALHSVDSDLATGNIKSGTTVFGILGTYATASYGLPKTGQQPDRPSGTPFQAGDDTYYASPEAAGMDVGYPRGTGNWAAYNTARFTDNGNGTITDNATGLMWVQDSTGLGCFSGETKTWSDAITLTEALSFAGYTDWRLPNIKELISIVDYGRASPALDPIFTSPISGYWSSTTYKANSGSAWSVYYVGSGSTSINDKTVDNCVRPVRGGQ